MPQAMGGFAPSNFDPNVEFIDLQWPDAQAMIHPAPKSSSSPSSVLDFLAVDFHTLVRELWRGHRAVEYLAAPDARRHLWHTWLCAPGFPGIGQEETSIDAFYARLTSSKGRELMTEGYGRCPPGLLSALGRLGPQARSPDLYRALFDVLAAEGPGAKLIRHTRSLSDDVVIGLARLPKDRACANAAIQAFRRGSCRPEDMGHFAWVLARASGLVEADAADAPVPIATSWEALWDLVLKLDFPPPPFPAVASLEPVRSPGELRQVGILLSNCLAGADRCRHELREVLNGIAYFYLWRGPEPALVRFQKVGTLGWYVDHLRGRKNATVSHATHLAIQTCLSTVACVCPISGAAGGGGALAVN